MNNKALHMIAFILLIVGGLNWLLVGVGVGDVVMMIFGDSIISTIVYVLVGLSAIYELITHKKTCTMCKGGSSASSMGGGEM